MNADNVVLLTDDLHSSRWWCPNCGIERTGDDLTVHCHCMKGDPRFRRRCVPEKRCGEGSCVYCVSQRPAPKRYL